MRVYLKCPCCGRTIFLVMEMELGSGFGLNYQQEKSQDWECLSKFLECLESSQGQKVYLGVNEREEGKIPEEVKELIMNWTEKGYKKPEEKPSNNQNWTKWKNISSNFTEELVKEWLNKGFTYETCADWVNINHPNQQNQAIKEANFYAWLRDTKKLTPEWMLNYGNSEELRREYDDR